MTALELVELIDARPSGEWFAAHCPAHDDRTRSLSFRDGDEGIIFKCHAGCASKTVAEAMARHVNGQVRDFFFRTTRAQPTTTYEYTDRTGRCLFQVVRFPSKEFRQRRPNGRGGWTWNLKGVERVLYNLPALAGQQRVFWVEGEKDADRLGAALGCAATPSPGGAAAFRSVYVRSLASLGVQEVIVLPDHDPVGWEYAAQVAQACRALGLTVRVVALPGLEEKQDVSDWLDQGGTIGALEALIAATPTVDSQDPSVSLDAARGERHLTDLGNARFLVARYGADLQYVPAWKGWLSWEGTHWQRSDRGQAEQRAKRALADLYAEASAQTDDEKRRQLVGHALRSESAGALRAMLELAQTEPGIPATPEDLDRDAWLLNVANGTLDLRSGALRPHHREDLITKLIPLSYDAAARAPGWDAFLTRIFAGNARLSAFLQRALGSALTDDTSDQVFFILWGQGANGKSTLIKTLMRILDGYAGQMATETLLRQRGGDAMLGLNDLATLHGTRFVAAMEADMGRPLAEALVKQLTGGDTIKVKRLYRDVFPIEPTFKVFLSTNHRPEIRGTEHAIWQRVRLISFTVTIPEAEQDKHLFERLSAEAPGILAWAVAGCLAWQCEGLGAPEEVRTATTAYRTEQDVVGRFLAERCVMEASGRIGAAQMARVYRAWAETTGEDALSAKALKAHLVAQGLKQKTTAQGAFWLGLRPRAPREPLSPPSPERTSMVDMVGAGGFSQNSSRGSALGESSPDTHQHPPSAMPPSMDAETSAPAERSLEDLFPIEESSEDRGARFQAALARIRAAHRSRRG